MSKGTIQKLPADLVEKIAAGEVVERPSSVVKELVENALDSGATSISVVVENGGAKLISVTDNGSGMSGNDLKQAILPHTTSKISHEDDLFAIHTLGFRGEALSTICAVSKVTLTSMKQSTDAEQLVVEGGIVVGLDVAAHNVGTTISVSDLFYNVPARQKFLKTQSVEFAQISNLMTQFVLSYPQVSFTLTHNGKSIIDSPSGSVIDVVGHMYGSQVAVDGVELSHETDAVRVEGLVIKPTHVRSDKKSLSFFVNGRWVKNSELAQAVIEGYDTLLMIGKYPIGVLYLTIDPAVIDVNVHPRKDIIKIEQEEVVLSAIRDAVRNAFIEKDLIRNASPAYEDDVTVVSNQTSDFGEGELLSSKPSAVPESTINSQVTLNTQSAPAFTLPSKRPKEYVVPESSQNVLQERAQPADDTHSFRHLGIIHKTYAVCEDKDGLILVDFHAAHERWNYEVFMDQFYQKSVKTQSLLEPVILEVTPTQAGLLTRFESELNSWGFDISEFGPQEFVVRSIPQVFGRQLPVDYVLELVEDLGSSKKQNSLEELQQSIITRMSCKASDRAGDDISSERAKQLIQFALNTKMKYACPHGRPTFVRITSKELEKMFKRRV